MCTKLRVKTVLALAFLLLIASFAYANPLSLTESSLPNYERVYRFQVNIGLLEFTYKIYVSVPPSLYDYYHSKSHSLSCISDYQTYVTPDAVKPIAKNIWSAIPDTQYREEQFANAVLMVAQQFTFIKSSVKYPVETIVEGVGDCDVLTLLSASIMKAADLDVVLLYYKNANAVHMNLGVHLPNSPVFHRLKASPTYYEYNGRKYWVAECTPGGKWRVGDQPQNLLNAKPIIIPLNRNALDEPGHVFSSLNKPPLKASSISITISQITSTSNGKTFRVSGSVSPPRKGCPIILYMSNDGSIWNMLKTASTDAFGNYSFTLTINSTGTYYIKTSWSGLSDCPGSDSETLAVFVKFIEPTSKIVMPDLEDWRFKDPQLRAQQAAIFKILYTFYNNSDKGGFEKFLKILGSGTNLTLSCEFIIFKENEKTESKFGFILKHNNINKSIMILDSQRLFQIVDESNGNEKILVKSKIELSENNWHKIIVTVSGNQIMAQLCDEDGNSHKMEVEEKYAGIVEYGVLVECDENATLAYKNLKIEGLNQTASSGNLYDSHQTQIWQTLIFLAIIFLLTVAVSRLKNALT